MKRIAVTLGLVLGVMVLLVLAATALVPWNSFRDRVAGELAALTGRQVVIDGDLGVSLWPGPTLIAANVRLLDGGEPMASLSSVALLIRPLSILYGQLEIEQLVLDGAEMRAILLPDAPGRWPIALSALGDATQVDMVVLRSGTLVLERAGGAVVRLAGLSGDLAAGGPDGPFALMASGALDGTPARLSLNAARRSANGAVPLRAVLTLPDARADLRFTGTLSPPGSDTGLDGDVALVGPDAAPILRLVQNLARLDLSHPGEDAAAATAQSPALSLRGRLVMTRQSVGMDGIELQWGDSRATGSVELPRDSDGAGSAVLAFTALDLDGLGADLVGRRPWLLRARLSLDLLADQGRWRGDILRDLRLVGRLGGGVLGDAELAATLPGGTVVAVKGAVDFSAEQPVFATDIDLKSDSVRDTLAWAGVAVDSVPPERLRQARLTGHLSGKPQDLSLTDAAGAVDTTQFSGAITLSRRDRLGIGLRLTLDRVDLDAYRLPDAPGLWPAVKPMLDDLDLTAQVNADQIQAAGLPADGIAIDADWTGGALTLRDATAQAIAGIAVKANGHLSDREGESSHLTLTATGTTLAPLLRALGRPDSALADRLGPVAVEARLVGDATRLAVDIRADALGGTTQVGGTIGNPTARADAELDVKLRSTLPETGHLLRLLLPDWRPAGPLGPLDLFTGITGPVAGTLALNGIQGQFAGHNINGALTWMPAAEARGAGWLEGKLALSALDGDLLAPALTRDGAAWNLGWTRVINGRLDLSASQLTLGGEGLREAALPLTLGNGLIRVEGATARWQGGEVTLTAALEQTAAAEVPADGTTATTEPPPLSGSLTLAVKDALLPGWIAGPSLGLKGGRFDLTLTGTGGGGTARAALSDVAGDGRFSLRSSTLTGLDMALVAKRMAEGGPKGPTQVRAALRAGGETAFDSLSLSFTLVDKIAALSGIDGVGPQGRVSGTGRWTWRDRTLDLTLTAKPNGPPDAPSLGIALSGPDRSPLRTLDMVAADAWLGKREAERLSRQAAAAAATTPAPAASTVPTPVKPTAQKSEKGGTVDGILERLKGKP